MCGICGFAGFEDRNLIKKMCDVVAHRGPDDFGFYTDKDLCLGNRRLAVIDVAGGRQPISNEDETVWIVYNGEIYNFLVLREKLENKGHRFKTNSDTEVIVHAYEEYGIDFVNRLRGMFAFALWDSNRRKLFLVRDRLGIKPLYYTRVDGVLVFASEIKSILEFEEVPREINPNVLEEYLRFRCVFAPATMFKHIFKLEPGSILEVTVGDKLSYVLTKYWELPVASDEHVPTFDEALHRFKELMRESVKMRLIADVPLGVFLSGGIDSSYVTALAASLMSERVKTFSVGFEDERYSELPYARAVAEYLGTDHHEYIVTEDSLKLLPEIVWYFDEPVADPAAIPTYILARETRKYVTVVLTGEGGDELFGGYEQYKILVATQRLEPVVKFTLRRDKSQHVALQLAKTLLTKAPPSVLDALLPHASSFGMRGIDRLIDYLSLIASGKYSEAYSELTSIYGRKELRETVLSSQEHCKKNLFPSKAPFEPRCSSETIKFVMDVETRFHLADNLLAKVDKMTMAHSLEARVPYLDHVVVEYVSKLPLGYKIRQSVFLIKDKHLLRVAAKDVLPSEITKRKKHRFVVPIGEWLSKDSVSLVQNMISNELGKLLRVEYLRMIKRDYDYSRLYYARQLWSLLTLCLWYKEFIEGERVNNLITLF